MELKDIFKMEMFKNWNNKPYLLVIAILTVMAAVATFWGIAAIEGIVNTGSLFWILFILLNVFFVIGWAVFSTLYPFHLLNTDYKNKAMSLIFASGVSRERYYFVKIGATLLTCSIAQAVILFIPLVAFLIVYTEHFVFGVQLIIMGFTAADVIPFVTMMLFSTLAYFVILTTSVIITRGKIVGIFLYFGFLFAISFVGVIITFPILMLAGEMSSHIVSTLFSIVQIVGFGWLGLHILRRQDL